MTPYWPMTKCLKRLVPRMMRSADTSMAPSTLIRTRVSTGTCQRARLLYQRWSKASKARTRLKRLRLLTKTRNSLWRRHWRATLHKCLRTRMKALRKKNHPKSRLKNLRLNQVLSRCFPSLLNNQRLNLLNLKNRCSWRIRKYLQRIKKDSTRSKSMSCLSSQLHNRDSMLSRIRNFTTEIRTQSSSLNH